MQPFRTQREGEEVLFIMVPEMTEMSVPALPNTMLSVTEGSEVGPLFILTYQNKQNSDKKEGDSLFRAFQEINRD